MVDSQLLFISILATVIGWLAIYFSPSRFKGKITSGFVFINAILTSIPAIHVLTSDNIEILLSGVLLIGEIPIRIDSLSAWFILIINLTSITGVVYGLGYMKSYSDQKSNLTLHWIQYLLFHSSMLWVCMVQNSIVFLIVWELMSLSSLMLVIFDHQNNKTLKAGLNYLVQMHIGVAVLTVAFIWVYFSTGSLDFSAIAQFFSTYSNIWLFLLFFIGFGIKAGFVPFHSWLPHAHPAAPSHISGVMSGVIVKVGIYGIFRMITFLNSDYLIIGESILALSVLTGLYGIINSAVHRDFKRMLAYCTIENVGIVGIGIGLGLIGLGKGNTIMILLGFGGALLHTLNHSLFKSLLFFSAGSIYQQTHTRDMEKLGGLIHKMPQTAFFFLIGALAIGGLPPFNGFISEFIIYKGMLEGINSSNIYHVILIIISFSGLSIIGGLSILVFTKSFGTIFLGSQRTELHAEPNEVSFSMRLPQYIIIAIMLGIGIFPAFFFSYTSQIIIASFPKFAINNIDTLNPFIHSLSTVGIYAAVFLILIVLVYFIRSLFMNKNLTQKSPTWGCGYVAPRASMQYTGKSYSKTLGKLLGFIVTEKKKYTELESNEVFPEKRTHSAYYTDFFESRIIEKITNQIQYFMNLFQFVQNGSTQMYIIYGLFFIVLIFLGTLFNII
ncbi:MAG: hypothetical protein A2W99_00290 [Bacteroidetes bacterium GWF2_33_16]|nr:MAG: hypothetical protein A2X00_02995 [Bacteroidetes bacterium GWE2_32_14]OFY08712.1 MAG: hypothetical protein A2W99_00290 [Bacteroidetes bacterium GWF2_33_16]